MKITRDVEVAERVLTEWGIKNAEIRLLQHWENIVYKVNQKYILRLHRQNFHTIEELNSEMIWLISLRKDGIKVPIPVMSQNNTYIVTDGTIHASLYKRIDGGNLSYLTHLEITPENLHYFEKMGMSLAQLHTQASTWNVPANFKRQSYDAETITGDNSKLGSFWDLPELKPRERSLLEETRQVVRTTLNQLQKTTETYSLIHGDLNPGNVIYTKELQGCPPGYVFNCNRNLSLIDFDDSGFGWHQYDFATLVYHHSGDDNFQELVEATLKGYRRYRAIELDLLPLFIVVKSLVNLSWSNQRKDLRPRLNILTRISRTCERAINFLNTGGRR